MHQNSRSRNPYMRACHDTRSSAHPAGATRPGESRDPSSVQGAFHFLCHPFAEGWLMPARVLVVDDSATYRMLIRARLCAEYYEVTEAGDGEQALELAAADPPDLVLLDLGLPGIDGLEVCRRLKGDAATTHVPVVMLTASDGRDDRVRGIETGADDFLTKPFDDLALISRVASLTRMKMMVDELA